MGSGDGENGIKYCGLPERQLTDDTHSRVVMDGL